MDIILVETLSGHFLLALLMVVPLWRICRRAGLHPALSLLVFLPMVGLVVALVVLALSRWPGTEGLA